MSKVWPWSFSKIKDRQERRAWHIRQAAKPKRPTGSPTGRLTSLPAPATITALASIASATARTQPNAAHLFSENNGPEVGAELTPEDFPYE